MPLNTGQRLTFRLLRHRVNQLDCAFDNGAASPQARSLHENINSIEAFFQRADKALVRLLKICGQKDRQQKKAMHLLVVYLDKARRGRVSYGSFTIDALCPEHIDSMHCFTSCADCVE